MQWFNIYSDRKITSRIDTFSASTGEKPGRNLYRTFPGSAGHGRKENIIMIPKNKNQYHSHYIKEWYFHLN